MVSLLTELSVVLVLRTHLKAWHSRPSPLLLRSTIAVIALAVALPYMPPLANAFAFVPLPLHLLLAAFAIVGAYIAATEFAKHRFYGHRRTAPPSPSG